MSLADMIAKQRAAAEEKARAGTTPKQSAAAADSVAGDIAGGVAATGIDAGAPKRTVVAGLRFGKPPTGSAKPAAPAPSKPVTSMVPDDARIDRVSEMTLDDLAETTEEGLEPTSQHHYHDEIPADAPDRELPADLNESQQAFVVQLDSIYEVVHDPELFGQMIRTIMQEMQENPDYMNLMADQDVHVMIRGLRESMGLAKIKKAEKSTKSRAGKAAPKTNEMVNSLDEMFNSEDW